MSGSLSNFVGETHWTRKAALFLGKTQIATSERTNASNLNDSVTLAVDHPYAAQSGDYLDSEETRGSDIDNDPVCINVLGEEYFCPSMSKIAIIHQFGHTSPQNITREGYLSDVEQKKYCVDSSFLTITCFEHLPATMAATWMATNAKARELIGKLSGTRMLHHHSIGYVQTDYINGQPDDSTMTADTAIAVAAMDNIVNAETAALTTFSSISGSLEGAITHENARGFDGGSVVSLFEKANRKAIKFLNVNAANVETALSNTVNYEADHKNFIRNYVSSAAGGQNLLLIIPQTGEIGDYAVQGGTATIVGRPLYGYNVSDGKYAHLVNDFYKGAGASVEDPVAAVEKLTEGIENSLYSLEYLGVDQATGNINLTPGPDLVNGQGAFPYSLSFNRYYTNTEDFWYTCVDTGTQEPNITCTNEKSGPNTVSYIAPGWSHNYDIAASVTTDFFQVLGEDSAVEASRSIAAIYTLFDLEKASSTFERKLVSTFVANWFSEDIIDNAVTIARPPSGALFVKLPDGSFSPPPQSQEELVQTGVPSNLVLRGKTLKRDYANVSFALTDGSGNVLNFDTANQGQPETDPLFKPTSWQFASGVDVFFDHEPVNIGDGFSRARLSKVRNSLGRYIEFTYGANSIAGYESHPVYRLDSIKDNAGREVVFSRTGLNRGTIDEFETLEVTLPEERKLAYDYHPFSSSGARRANLLYRFRAAAGDENELTTTIEFDSLSRAKSLTNPRSEKTNYHIGALSGEQFKRSELVDALDHSTISIFDDRNNNIKTIDALGNVSLKEYDGIGRLTKETMPEGNATEYIYDARHNMTESRQTPKTGVSGPAIVTKAGYSSDCNNLFTCNKPQSVTDERGNRVLLAYDAANGNLLRRIEELVANDCQHSMTTSSASCAVTNFTYNSLGQLTSMENAEGIKTDYAYYLPININSNTPHTFGELRSIKEDPAGLGLLTEYSYDVVGNIVKVDGPRTDVTDKVTMFYNARRQLQYVVQGDINANNTSNVLGTAKTAEVESVLQTSYDSLDRPTLQRQWGFAYGTNTVDEFYQDTQTIYTPTGQVDHTISPDNAKVFMTYDALDRQVIADAQVDGSGEDGNNRRTRTVYDALGRVQRIYQAWETNTGETGPCYVDGSSSDQRCYQRYTYTPNGQVESVVDANGNKTLYEYDGYDRLLATYFPSETRTANPNVIGSHNTGDRERLRYDAAGNVIGKRTRRGDWIINCYDALNRLTKKRVYEGGNFVASTDSCPASPVSGGTLQSTVDYSYYLDGRDYQIVQTGSTSTVGQLIPNVTLTYGYDTAGRQTSETVESFDDSGTLLTTRAVNTTVDQAGNRKTLTYPAAGTGGSSVSAKTISFDYDYRGNLALIKEVGAQTDIAEYIYDHFARRTGTILHDTDGDIATTTDQLATAYSYEIDNALDSLSHLFVEPQDTVTDVSYGFDYNLVNQITSRSISNLDYRYDAAGNDRKYYSADGLNQYDCVSTVADDTSCTQGIAPLYDASGNLTSYDSWTYTYDVENRLVQATSGSLTMTYEYDAKGRRFASEKDDGTQVIRKEFLYEGDEPIADYLIDGSTSKLMARYLHGAGVDERLMYWQYDTLTGATTVEEYYLTNHQRSVVATADAKSGNSTLGQQVHKYTYDAYGNIGANEGTTQPFRYTGRRYDDETGLYYYRARYYSAELGRFLQTDPIGYEDNMNLYGYTGNDPVNMVDPFGLECISIMTGGEEGNEGETIITCKPDDDDAPIIDFPAPNKDWPNRLSDSIFYHSYRVNSDWYSGGDSCAAQLQAGLIEDPTPGPDSPASPSGTTNDASPFLGITGRDDVSSYSQSTHSGSAVINVTQSNHTLSNGYVVRFVQRGDNGNSRIVSYGEGDAWQQGNWNPINGIANNLVWGPNHDDIASKAKDCQKVN